MSDSEADLSAVRELDQLVRHLGDELAKFRRRALTAEARVRTFEALAGDRDLFLEQRLTEAEGENSRLLERLTLATERTQALLERVRFLRQQQEAGSGR